MSYLIDSTLREGEQRAHIYFTLEQKINIIKLLGQIGIEEIEVGVAAPDSELKELVEAVRSEAPMSRVAVWCRCLPEDIALGASFNPDVLSIALPVSDGHLIRRLGKTREWALQQITVAADEARKYDVPYISLGMEDATRSDKNFIDDIATATSHAGFNRIRLADTVGIATPARIAALVARLRKNFPLEIAIHAHNDFGMATANSITALDTGADWADVTVLGIGERAGNAKLEEVAGFMNLRRNNTRYKIDIIRQLANYVSEITGERVSSHHPIIGDELFVCESGIHIDGLQKDKTSYEPFPAEVVGADRDWIIGKKSGLNAVLAAVADMKLNLDTVEASILTMRIRSTSKMLGRPLTNEEIAELVDTF